MKKEVRTLCLTSLAAFGLISCTSSTDEKTAVEPARMEAHEVEKPRAETVASTSVTPEAVARSKTTGVLKRSSTPRRVAQQSVKSEALIQNAEVSSQNEQGLLTIQSASQSASQLTGQSTVETTNQSAGIPEQPTKLESSAASPEESISKKYLMSFWLGLGVSYVDFDQKTSVDTETGHFSDQTLNVVSFGVSCRVNEKSSVDFQYQQLNGKIPTQGTTALDSKDLIEKSMSLDYQYRLSSDHSRGYSLTLGLQNHHEPILSTDQAQNLVNVLDIELFTAALGIKYNQYVVKDYEAEVSARYQTILTSRSSNSYSFHASPVMMVDVSVGLVRHFVSGLRLGVYGIGKSLNYNYDLTRDSVSVSGSQTLRDVTVEARVGWEF